MAASTSDAQSQELDALCAIYDNAIEVDLGRGGFSIDLSQGPDRPVRLAVSLPPDYPFHAPPTHQLTAPWMSARQKKALRALLEDSYHENVGEPVLYLWVEAVRDYVRDLLEGGKADENEGCSNSDPGELLEDLSLEEEPEVVDLPEVFSGHTIHDRKSTFQGHIAAVDSPKLVPLILDRMRQNPKIARATHNIFAYRIFDGAVKYSDSEDDGEHTAGPGLLRLLELADARNVLVIVSRWYGGIHLGPDRFKHINNVAREVMVEKGYIKHGIVQNKNKPAKKKGKR